MHVRNEAKPDPTKRQLSMHFHITFTIIVRTHCDKHIRFDRHSSNDFVSRIYGIRDVCLCVCYGVQVHVSCYLPVFRVPAHEHEH